MTWLALLLNVGLLAQAEAAVEAPEPEVEGVATPVALTVMAPAIPPEAFLGGVVIAQIDVSDSGGVEGVHPLSVTPPYEDPVVDALGDWKFQPPPSGDPEASTHALVVAVFRPNTFPDTPMAPATDAGSPARDVPFPLETPPPPYPVHAVGDATVILEADVDAAGEVDSVRPLSGAGAFVDVSLDTVRGWTFQPASLDGSPASSKAYVVIAFREPITVPTTTPSDTGTDTTTTDTGS